MTFKCLIVLFFICASSSVSFETRSIGKDYYKSSKDKARKSIKDDPTRTFIIKGVNAPVGEYPHQVSLQQGSHVCGAAIVNFEWVISAAHCVAGRTPEGWTVLAGTNTLDSGGTSYEVLEIYPHEKFNHTTIENDVAILKVKRITFTDVIQPILAETEDVGAGENVTLSGWGLLDVEGSLSNYLQHITLITTTVEYCQRRHVVVPVFESSICTLGPDGRGACHGDSGGPLIRTVNGQRRLIGIVSWGEPCAVGYPDVFAKISFYIDWFNNICHCL